jgi:hypothetical protein
MCSLEYCHVFLLSTAGVDGLEQQQSTAIMGVIRKVGEIILIWQPPSCTVSMRETK